MENRLISACTILLILNSPAALGNDSPAREFNPKFELAYFEPIEGHSVGSAGLVYEAVYTAKLNDPLTVSTDKPKAIGDRIYFFNFNLYSKGNVPFKEDFPVGNYIETGFDLGSQSNRLKSLDQCLDGECSNNIQDDSFIAKFSATYQFESDRDFDNKQHAYGGKLRLTYKKSEESKIQYLNPLEWGPSVVKAIVGRTSLGDEKLKAAKPFEEAYLPSINIAVEQVNPEKDSNRKEVDPELDKFERVRIDISYASTLLKLRDDVYRASFTFRHFQEISPEENIEDANLDSFTYRTFAIHTPGDIIISYSKGKLPFDAESDAMFKIGWSYNF